MRYATGALWTLLFAAGANAAEVKTAISVTLFECQNPTTDPACVAFDEASKAKSCPGCTTWKEVSVDVDATAKTKPEYSRPSKFIDDVASQMYGEGLPKGIDGRPISIASFYEHHEQYGWVEIPAGQSRKGTVAVLPYTAGVVVTEKDNGDFDVVYSSTKRGGDVTKTDLDYLTRPGAVPIFVLPAKFLKNGANEGPSKP